MRTRLLALVGLTGLALAITACVSLKRTPDPRFFVLRSLVEPPPAPEAAAISGLVGVLPVSLPGALDRAQVVAWEAPGELRIDEFLRWAEPLDGGVTRVLAENLAALLPEYRVIRHPWPGASVLRCRVRVELRVFGPQENGEVRLEGRWALLPERAEKPLVLRPVSLRRGPLGSGPNGPDAGVGVEAMSELVAELSRTIAEAVRGLPADAES